MKTLLFSLTLALALSSCSPKEPSALINMGTYIETDAGSFLITQRDAYLIDANGKLWLLDNAEAKLVVKDSSVPKVDEFESNPVPAPPPAPEPAPAPSN